jgi:hypothetical protein
MYECGDLCIVFVVDVATVNVGTEFTAVLFSYDGKCRWDDEPVDVRAASRLGAGVSARTRVNGIRVARSFQR